LDSLPTLGYSDPRASPPDLWRSASGTPLRSFRWWFAIGALLTLSVLMVQGGVRDLLDGASPGSGASAYLSFGTTIFGGGLLAGCLALVMNRLR
ncbi:MAG TPA: hypothetical protein VF077_06260, partial [Nitrospiraceae bacterium]